ncbi:MULTISPECIES: molybdopterin-synthase adenylyltransferase MoeB [Sorangium]|uniref:Molybdopterin-synthase adenylyltransferase n=2 Tax=Sorangium cellulosum TaxID=56 RepID=A0A150PH60_SORCE|nr:molybdopterin-synthase adenylyltransferase MoeB [Sorangium cellulosum]AGP32480.1 molybdopterin biosynthesis protein MoeB [Sorangium cellulosum So0157-2]KYF55015.1 molybdopterin biosynthesis protein MoeB [Sorangium cellulosum]
MPTTYSDLISDVRKSIRELSLSELKRRLDDKVPMVLLDVREKEEYRAGFIPGAISIPRAFLEMQVEQKLPDKSAHIVAYCAGGTRSALAAKTLQELGYTNVESANPGFVRWKDLSYPVELPPNLTEAQRDRYSRHLLLPEVGEAGQAKLLASKVLLLGAGGLGSPAALYLAAAGVGTLGLVDADVVDNSNLQRQILHATSRVGMPKVDSAETAIRDLNPDVKVVKFQERVDSSNVDRIFDQFDIIVDGCDNFPTRYLVNDASVFKKKPVVHGSIFRFEGQVTTFMPGVGPCYRCLYPEPPPPHLAPSCQEAGVLGILPGIIGIIQATEAVKLILGQGTPLIGRLLTYDSLRMKFGELKLRRDKSCPACGESPTITSYIDYEGFCLIG